MLQKILCFFGLHGFIKYGRYHAWPYTITVKKCIYCDHTKEDKKV